MNRTPSKLKAALWMAGFLSLMLLMAISGREAARELKVFQIMELRSTLGLLMLCPVIYFTGGFAVLPDGVFLFLEGGLFGELAGGVGDYGGAVGGFVRGDFGFCFF